MPHALSPIVNETVLATAWSLATIDASRAGVTQLAECLLPKQNVAGSNPVSRSTLPSPLQRPSMLTPRTACPCSGRPCRSAARPIRTRGLQDVPRLRGARVHPFGTSGGPETTHSYRPDASVTQRARPRRHIGSMARTSRKGLPGTGSGPQGVGHVEFGTHPEASAGRGRRRGRSAPARGDGSAGSRECRQRRASAGLRSTARDREASQPRDARRWHGAPAHESGAQDSLELAARRTARGPTRRGGERRAVQPGSTARLRRRRATTTCEPRESEWRARGEGASGRNPRWSTMGPRPRPKSTCSTRHWPPERRSTRHVSTKR